MKYKIIVYSCGELTPEMKQDERFASAALTLEVGADTIVDDDSFDQADFLAKVAASKESVQHIRSVRNQHARLRKFTREGLRQMRNICMR